MATLEYLLIASALVLAAIGIASAFQGKATDVMTRALNQIP